jgi:hypothetical protein
VTLAEERGELPGLARLEGRIAIVTGGGQVDGPGVGTGKAMRSR